MPNLVLIIHLFLYFFQSLINLGFFIFMFKHRETVYDVAEKVNCEIGWKRVIVFNFEYYTFYDSVDSLSITL